MHIKYEVQYEAQCFRKWSVEKITNGGKYFTYGEAEELAREMNLRLGIRNAHAMAVCLMKGENDE